LPNRPLDIGVDSCVDMGRDTARGMARGECPGEWLQSLCEQTLDTRQNPDRWCAWPPPTGVSVLVLLDALTYLH
jgi:hypothetical protein